MIPRAIRDRLPPFPRSFWLLWAGSFMNRLGTFVVPFLSLFLTGTRHFTFAEAGKTVALFGLGSVFAGPLGGALTDKAGRKATLALGLALGAITLFAIYLAQTPRAIALAVFTCGLCSDLFRPAFSATIADLIPPAQRPRAFSLAYWAHNLAFAMAMPMGAVLARTGYAKLFFADAGTNLLFAALILLGIPETKPASKVPADIARSSFLELPRGFFTAAGDLPFLGFVIATVLVCTCLFQSLSALPLAMSLNGIDAEHFGYLIAINGVLIVTLQPFAERLFGRLRPSPRLALAAAILGVGMGLQAFCALPIHYILAITLWTMGEIALAGIGPATTAHLAPLHLRGAYQGLYGMAWSIGACLAPLTGPRLLQARGPRVLWLAVLALAVLASASMLALGRRLERPATEV